MDAIALHGGWIPGNSGGRFFVWAEKKQERKREIKDRHPFQLQRDQLRSLAASLWPSTAKNCEIAKVWTVLPGNEAGPAPSLELQSAGVEGITPDQWQAWRLDALILTDPLAFLKSMDIARSDQSLLVGHDMRFWSSVAERLADALLRHEYLPAMFPMIENGRRRGRGNTNTRSLKIELGWEFTDSMLDSCVAPFARSMPGICRSAWDKRPHLANGAVPMRDPEDLVRNFFSTNLQRQIWSTKVPHTAQVRFDKSFVGPAMRPPDSTKTYIDVGLTEFDWRKWQRWRDMINSATSNADERICFRLVDPSPDSPDEWRLQWLLTFRRDPSLQIPLSKFWNSEKSSRCVKEVLLQLGQAARLYGRIWDGMDSAAPSEVILDRQEALEFLRESAPILQGAGFSVIVPSWWTATGQRRLRRRMTARSAGSSRSGAAEDSGLFGMDALVEWQPTVVIDGVPLSDEEWEAIVKAKEGLVYMRGEWMELNLEEVARLEEFWNAGGDPASMSMGELLRAQAEEETEVVFEGDLEQAMAFLHEEGALAVQDQPPALNGSLRNYQIRGFSWLAHLERLGFGACLADDMGLGKTIQVLSVILHEKSTMTDGGTTLLIAPTSLLGNWQRESRRFAPSLKTMIFHGAKRARSLDLLQSEIQGIDLVIASYGVARLDAAVLNKIKWRRLVVDEAQYVKNPGASITKALRTIPANSRIALTGTPVENRLLDLWSLFNVVNPGFLGNVTEFKKSFERPIMRDGDRAALGKLRETVRPFILRRLKTDKSIISDLPDKVEQNAFCNLTEEQATLYEAVVRDADNAINSLDGIDRAGLMLSTLMKLKQICNHPAQFHQDGSEFAPARSHKLARACDMLDEISAEGESALLFTQFTEIGNQLQNLLKSRGFGSVYYLHGGTPMAMREHMVEQFQNDDAEPAIFVLSLRAAGVGLTLTRANHVIHFDRWWNPAVENQATDRAYRIGQTRMVMVHKMVTMGTLEERIDNLIESKKQLAEDIVGADESWLSDMGDEAFSALIRLDRGDAVVS
ncbi:MAG: DEAD/DEAH box helicase [Albidovulum sp.]|nr:DEAD/DEAH box helicase [Albidovulum sp.]